MPIFHAGPLASQENRGLVVRPIVGVARRKIDSIGALMPWCLQFYCSILGDFPF